MYFYICVDTCHIHKIFLEFPPLHSASPSLTVLCQLTTTQIFQLNLVFSLLTASIGIGNAPTGSHVSGDPRTLGDGASHASGNGSLGVSFEV